MRNSKKLRLFALILSLALVLAALPMGMALAAADIEQYDGKDIISSLETDYLQTRAGHIGDEISFYVPIKNVSGGQLTDLSASVAVSSNIADFPFENPDASKTAVDVAPFQKADADAKKLIAWDGKTLEDGQHAYFKVKFTFAAGATQSYYEVPVTITYNGGSTLTLKVRVFCRGVDTTGGGSGGGGSSYKSKPKVIIESYEFSEDTIYAGDTVKLDLIIANTSSREAITNLQLDYANEAGAVLPAPGSSSSVYLGTIDKNGVRALTLELQIVPGAEAKSQVLALTLSYEGTKNRADFEEKASISVPVLQKARVRINDPVIYDDPWVGSSVSAGVTLYNLGKSTLYNCMVDVVGEGLTLEESYFGGNVAPGATMRADLNITPEVSGELEAKVRVTYEDINGNETEELLPLKMTVNADDPGAIASPGNGGMEIPGDKPASANIGWIFWTLGAIVAITGLVFLVIKLKKKRERALEDL
ncbi:MAG: hypothetical protein VB062_11150 [Christensenella sp.]|nr:hypothetical protein [Christensenella sp.]